MFFFQSWSVVRQMVRFALVTRNAVLVSSQIQKPLKTFMGSECRDVHRAKQIELIKVSDPISSMWGNALIL